MKHYIIGIDTSAYTTSIAIVDEQTKKILYDKRKVLLVPTGQKGLRQQEAVFQHLQNFNELYNNINIDFSEVKTVSVSSRPRNVEGSYMPVFTVGQNYGKIIAKTLNAEYVEYSHQENHIAASLIENDNYKHLNENILAIHISGGTTEFLSVKKSNIGYESEIIGGSKDITFGQLIDRIGTEMGFNFPCGLYMEKHIENDLDIKSDNSTISNIKLPKISGETFINLSGMENYYKNLLNTNKYNNKTIINSLFKYISTCIVEIINKLNLNYSFNSIIIAGGVASNNIIRNDVNNMLKQNYNVIFPAKENSSDNAVGVAYMPIIDRWYHEIKTY
ncbi:MAG: O-sialoglycoprotein endopeptidase [Bacillota bacterium]|nr:O-sialoglycoprotein endopeptidase [Bacillota bacterium]